MCYNVQLIVSAIPLYNNNPGLYSQIYADIIIYLSILWLGDELAAFLFFKMILSNLENEIKLPENLFLMDNKFCNGVSN